jgi:hypothetical protein
MIAIRDGQLLWVVISMRASASICMLLARYYRSLAQVGRQRMTQAAKNGLPERTKPATSAGFIF